jgi:hypothetical protein
LNAVNRADSESFVAAVADLIGHVEGVLHELGVEAPATEIQRVGPRPEGGYEFEMRRKPST